MSDSKQTSELHAPSSTTLPLLLEVGCEEIPARFLTQAQQDLGDRLKSALDEARLLAKTPDDRSQATDARSQEEGAESLIPGHSSLVTVYSTPRRLVAFVPQILARQPDKTEEITGPSVRIAVDAQGKYTKAAESFARKNSAGIEDLARITTPKGEYVAVRKITQGRPALEVLSEILPGVITGISFPKSMYWTGKSGPRFARPIRWILVLLGEGELAQVVPFEIAGVKSGNLTSGHRALGREPVPVSGFKEYVQKLNDLQVELEPENRRTRVLAECKALLEGSGLRIVEDNGLVDWVVNSTEWPRALKGKFEERFLKLPREILVTVMRDHQKYFAVESEKGSLHPSFVTLLNVEGDAQGVIRRGHERVLTARFSDAEFFWNADQRIPLRDRTPMLEKVTYQAKLGSYADKVRRMELIAREICATLEAQGKISAAKTAHALRAVRLCKCDLTTQMVQEFTELQGLVGGLYAKSQGEAPEVAEAIYDHYKPQGVEDDCPRSIAAAVVAFADKIDSVIAGFSVGLEPTGSSDPFGLRRAGNGIVKISVELLPDFNLMDFAKGLAERANQLGLPEHPDLLREVTRFLRERAEHYLSALGGLRYDTVRAVVKSFNGWALPATALARGRALERIRDTEDFRALSLAAKRTRNILEKSAHPEDSGSSKGVDEKLLADGPERDLYNSYQAARAELKKLVARRAFEDAFVLLAGLRPAVDLFFDKVLVMAENPVVRSNRLRLLGELQGLVFSRLADLSQIESSTSIPVGAPTSIAAASDD